tara:strand:- start:858 stop:1106 length:249 start_codon:yes stop_codon:yes gene_type:complete
MSTEKDRLLEAQVLINDLYKLTKDNKFEKYLHQHLIVVEYELERQLSLIRADERRRLSISNQQYADDAKQQRSQLPDTPSTD